MENLIADRQFLQMSSFAQQKSISLNQMPRDTRFHHPFCNETDPKPSKKASVINFLLLHLSRKALPNSSRAHEEDNGGSQFCDIHLFQCTKTLPHCVIKEVGKIILQDFNTCIRRRRPIILMKSTIELHHAQLQEVLESQNGLVRVRHDKFQSSTRLTTEMN
ncbi:unnamed protein product [Lepeophtheirus salmonis]|uniref:(salmon louse) hypothetical protein n=1 Tax=Lepeophtheirus salmonis TaxID=72036 RepID=A0A7R8CYZ8_LEPSM|nr:unnamed protein product [Lepeophtheirus salmonis]CAF2972691.1 unnamed protein product [Lepeophtheirus salmonis]